jgi:hypothetical protein
VSRFQIVTNLQFSSSRACAAYIQASIYLSEGFWLNWPLPSQEYLLVGSMRYSAHLRSLEPVNSTYLSSCCPLYHRTTVDQTSFSYFYFLQVVAKSGSY